MAANLCPPPTTTLRPTSCCNYAAVAEGNLEMVSKHDGSRYGGGPENTAVKSLGAVGKTTVNWLFNHIVYVSNPVGGSRLRHPSTPHLLPHPPPPPPLVPSLHCSSTSLAGSAAGGADKQRPDQIKWGGTVEVEGGGWRVGWWWWMVQSKS